MNKKKVPYNTQVQFAIMADIASEAPTVELGNQWVRTADRMPDIPGDEKSWAHVSVIAAKKAARSPAR